MPHVGLARRDPKGSVVQEFWRLVFCVLSRLLASLERSPSKMPFFWGCVCVCGVKAAFKKRFIFLLGGSGAHL